MRTLRPLSSVAALGALLLAGCAEPQSQALAGEQALPLSRQATLDAAGSGQAGYFCRRAVCAGDDGENNAVRGLLEFDLGALPAGVRSDQIVGATLRIYQGESGSTYAGLQALVVEHIRVSELSDVASFDAPPLEIAVNDASGEGYVEVDVSRALQKDLAQGRSSAQFRLRFSRPTNNDSHSNLALFSTDQDYGPQLILRPGKP